MITTSPIAGQALTDDELDWYLRHNLNHDDDPGLLSPVDAQQLWDHWWTENKGDCNTCGYREGHCDYEHCIRLRVTDKVMPMVWKAS